MSEAALNPINPTPVNPEAQVPHTPEVKAGLAHRSLLRFHEIRSRLSKSLPKTELPNPIDGLSEPSAEGIASHSESSPEPITEPVAERTGRSTSKSLELGRERVKAIFERSHQMTREASKTARRVGRVGLDRASEKAGKAADKAKDRASATSETVYKYFTDEEKGTKRVIVAGAVGATAVAAGYGVYRYRKNANERAQQDQNQTAQQQAEQAERERQEAFESRRNDWSIASPLDLDAYADQIDFRNTTMADLIHLGYNARSASELMELIRGDAEGQPVSEPALIRTAAQLRAYTRSEQERGQRLDNLIATQVAPRPRRSANQNVRRPAAQANRPRTERARTGNNNQPPTTNSPRRPRQPQRPQQPRGRSAQTRPFWEAGRQETEQTDTTTTRQRTTQPRSTRSRQSGTQPQQRRQQQPQPRRARPTTRLT